MPSQGLSAELSAVYEREIQRLLVGYLPIKLQNELQSEG